jgi:hypothetical protein
VILGQNYLQYGSHFYQPNKGNAMRSPISSTLAKIYLQYFEKIHLKHHLETKNIIYYKRNVDDLYIIYDQTKINEETIHDIINNTDEHLEFKITKEENYITYYLDLNIQRKHNKVELNIYRKPTYIDTAIHFMSNHPYPHKMASFYFYINRMTNILCSEQAIKQEWDRIITTARNNGFPVHLIHRLRNKITTQKNNTTSTQ